MHFNNNCHTFNFKNISFRSNLIVIHTITTFFFTITPHFAIPLMIPFLLFPMTFLHQSAYNFISLICTLIHCSKLILHRLLKLKATMWNLLVATGNQWQPHAAIGNHWQPLSTTGNHCQQLVTTGDRWRPVATNWKSVFMLL